MTLRTEAPRAKSRWASLGIAVVAGSLLLVPAVFATAPSTGATFEASDGNLAPDSNPDWNSFNPVTWTGTAPYQSAVKNITSGTLNGWKFQGLTDAQALTSDTGFAGGVKQDDDCATLKGGKAPNKDDLKRAYMATKTAADGHTYLMLAWVRIPQNTVNASAHVGFEFNQGNTPCVTGDTTGPVHRQAGDLLVVYDFEGSSSGAASLSIRRWTTTASDPCDVSSDSAPCWGVADQLNSNEAEAKVNTTGFPTLDALAIGSGNPAIASPGQNLGQSEFGEAGIDLTAAGVLSTTDCTSFGTASVISRSSGNSGQAAMEDLVGPAKFTVSNCGTLIVKKVTDPSPDTSDTAFHFAMAGGGTSNAGIWPNADVPLKNGETYSKNVFPAANFSAAETLVTGWDLTSASCDNSSGTKSGSTLSGITVAVSETVTCTFTNTKAKTTPTYTSAPSVIPQDKVTIASLDTSGSASGTSDQKMTVSLYSTTDCSGTALYSKTFTVTANGDYVTNNSGDPSATPAGYTITASGLYKWQVIYNGDTRNNGFTGACGDESVNVTLTPKT
jgi:hypothetical protein